MNLATVSTPVRDAAESRRGIAYQSRGAGPAVLLIHGWCLDRTVWMYLEQSLLAEGWRVISVDLAGYGESRTLSGPFTLRRHADDVVDLLEELNLNEVTLVGFAFGAAVLLDIRDDSRVRAMVSIGMPSAAGAPYPKMRSAMLRDWPLFASRSARAICAKDHSDASMDWLADIFARTPLNSALAGVEVLAKFEPLEQTQAWSVPTLFVHGADDTIVSPTVSKGCVERFTGAQLHIVSDSGHFVPWDQPAELAIAIVDFASSVGA